MEASPIELIPHLQTKLPKSYKNGEVNLAQSWAVRVTTSASIGWPCHDGEDKIRLFCSVTDYYRVWWPMVTGILVMITIQVANPWLQSFIGLRKICHHDNLLV